VLRATDLPEKNKADQKSGVGKTGEGVQDALLSEAADQLDVAKRHTFLPTALAAYIASSARLSSDSAESMES